MPPKRKSEVANEAGSNPEPVQKKRITAPKISPTSNLIVTAHSTLPPKDFVQLLKSSVLSKVESLSAEQLEEISAVLQTAIGEQRGRTEILDKIQYAAREKSIKGQLKDFQKSVRVNWKHCYDEQYETMTCIADEMREWMQDIYAVGVQVVEPARSNQKKK